MAKSLSPLKEMLPDPGLAGLFFVAQTAPAERLLFIERLRQHAVKSGAAFKRQSRQFEKMYKEAQSLFSEPVAFQKLAEAILKEEQGIAERLNPWIETLEQCLERAPKSVTSEELNYIKECLEIAKRWQSLYFDLRHDFLRLAATPTDQTKKTLDTKLTKGAVDHGALTDEIIARFPNILKALAE
jgi:hypothetical protein